MCSFTSAVRHTFVIDEILAFPILSLHCYHTYHCCQCSRFCTVYCLRRGGVMPIDVLVALKSLLKNNRASPRRARVQGRGHTRDTPLGWGAPACDMRDGVQHRWDRRRLYLEELADDCTHGYMRPGPSSRAACALARPFIHRVDLARVAAKGVRLSHLTGAYCSTFASAWQTHPTVQYNTCVSVIIRQHVSNGLHACQYCIQYP